MKERKKRYSEYVYEDLKKNRLREQEAKIKEEYKERYLKNKVETIERQKSEWRSDF